MGHPRQGASVQQGTHHRQFADRLILAMFLDQWWLMHPLQATNSLEGASKRHRTFYPQAQAAGDMLEMLDLD